MSGRDRERREEQHELRVDDAELARLLTSDRSLLLYIKTRLAGHCYRITTLQTKTYNDLEHGSQLEVNDDPVERLVGEGSTRGPGCVPVHTEGGCPLSRHQHDGEVWGIIDQHRHGRNSDDARSEWRSYSAGLQLVKTDSQVDHLH